ncbi:RNA polymerase factor sigma-32 [Desulfobacterota bacterium M19]
MKVNNCLIMPMKDELIPLKYRDISRYMRDISQYRLLSKEETYNLTRRVYEEGDKKAGRTLVVSNLRLVVKLVMNFRRYWKENFLDLIQEGNFGLARAVDKYDPHRGVQFSSYAAYWIRAYILKFIMDNWRLVKIGTTQAQRKLFYSLNREKKNLESRGIKADNSTLARRLKVRIQDIQDMEQRLNNHDLSLESPIADEHSPSHKTFLQSSCPGVEEEVAEHEYLVWFLQRLEDLRPELSEREQVILFERLLREEPRTLSNIADQFAISRERIRQIETALLKRLKTIMLNEEG